MASIHCNAATVKKYAPSTRCCTLLTESNSAELARKQGRTGRAHNFGTIVALVHFVTVPTVKSVTAIAHANLMIRLKLMAPVAVLANIRATLVAANLNVGRFCSTVETKFTAIAYIIIVVDIIIDILYGAFYMINERRHVVIADTVVVSALGASCRLAEQLFASALRRRSHILYGNLKNVAVVNAAFEDSST